MLNSDDVLAFMRKTGPVIPGQVAKAVETSMLFASAMLSELSSKGKIKVSSVKFGGTPLYYLPEHASKLQNYSSNLNEKDQKAYEKLKEGKVLRDNALEPLTRVSLRAIKDFAVPLTVQVGGQSEIFWKWYLLSHDDAVEKIRNILSPPQEKVEEKKEEQHEKTQQQEQPKQEEKTEEKKEVKEEVKQSEPKLDQPKQEVKKELKKEENVSEQPKQQTLSSKSSSSKTKTIEPGPFLDDVQQFCASNSMIIHDSTIIRKNAEYDLIVEVSSSVGGLKYFCKVKNKKLVNDGDLSSAFLEAQSKQLPALFLTPGKLTKKAQGMLSTTLKGVHVVFMN